MTPSTSGPATASTADAAEAGHVASEEVVGEGDVAGLLGDVDAHDALDERMTDAALEHLALEVVDGLLAAEHEQEEEGRIPLGDVLDGVLGREPPAAGQTLRGY